jgi:two-component system chemotaxis response regulator CheB
MRDHYIEPVRGPKENFSRPAVDALFRSGAAAHSKHAIGVVLSGWGSDGVAGLMAIKRAGGVAVVQDPQQARAPIMPFNALARDHVDWVVTVEQMPDLLLQLVQAEAVDDRSPA